MKGGIYHIIFTTVCLLLSGVTFAQQSDNRFKIVIDPGHGGKDHGAIGAVTNEKSINLKVASKLKNLILSEMSDANVIMTRSDDRFVTLQKRADIANDSDGDLFVSIHANSLDKRAKNRKTVNGASVYTLGLSKSEENFAVAKRENAVMMLEDDYTTTYQGFDPTSTESYIIFEMNRDLHMDQSIKAAQSIQEELVKTANRRDRGVRQAPYWVLVKTSMPAVLVELDFICNPEQEQFMKSDKGQDKLARAIFNGIRSYKASFDHQSSTVSRNKNRKASATAKAATESRRQQDPAKTTNRNETVYKIQFLISKKLLPANSEKFKGLKNVDHYIQDGLIKYTYGEVSSPEEASKLLEKVKHSFTDAFIIKMRNGKRIN